MMLAGIWISSCTESPLGQTPTDSVPPPPLENVAVEEMPGGAIITYDLPKNDPDILYVKGEYLSQGVKKTVRASTYDNRLVIEGLGSTDPVVVTLYVVDHSENTSTPVNAGPFNPKTPPIESIYASLTMDETVGGVLVQWENPTGTEIGVALFASDSLGEFKQVDIRFYALKEGWHPFRGFDSIEQKFGVQITDKWGNISPVKEWTITPIYEKELDRTLHKQFVLPWDNISTNGGGQTFDKIFDDQKTNTGNNSWHTQENQSTSVRGFTVPVLFTVDLGVEATLSRFLLWQGRYAESFLYSHHNPKKFEVWGTMEISYKPDDYWSEEWKKDWVMLGDYEIIKPSGLPLGELSNDDKAAANAGHEFSTLMVPVRYLRFVVKSTWIGDKDNAITIHQLEFHGNDNI
jgi:hypothetical protein